jgi:hypothetical protein
MFHLHCGWRFTSRVLRTALLYDQHEFVGPKGGIVCRRLQEVEPVRALRGFTPLSKGVLKQR